MVAPPHTTLQLAQLPLVTYVAALEAPWSLDYVSPQIEALLGFAPEEFVAEPDFWLGRVAAEDRERFLETWTAVRDTHDGVAIEYRLLARDGHEVWVRDTATIVSVDGLVTIHGFITDITREKELELELARERAQTDAFFRDSSVGMAITDAEGRLRRSRRRCRATARRGLADRQTSAGTRAHGRDRTR
jgi:PAS domain S-box-containing protein